MYLLFVFISDDIIALNKPPGLPVSVQKSDDEVTFVSVLPEVADAIGHPSAEIVTGSERYHFGKIYQLCPFVTSRIKINTSFFFLFVLDDIIAK